MRMRATLFQKQQQGRFVAWCMLGVNTLSAFLSHFEFQAAVMRYSSSRMCVCLFFQQPDPSILHAQLFFTCVFVSLATV